jgi:hypothetical protein
MKRSWLKVVFLSALGFVAAVDVVHEVLNRMFRPFTGSLDTAMHYVLYASLLLYFVACLWGCFWLASRFVTFRFSYECRHAATILLVLVAMEFAFTSFAAARGLSSQYHPSFPDFVAGAILALATLAAGREHLQTRFGRIVVVLLVFCWLVGNLTVDFALVDGGHRTRCRSDLAASAGWCRDCWQSATPYLSWSSLAWFLEFPRPSSTSVQPSRSCGGWSLAFAIAWCLRRLVPNRAWLTSSALTASIAFLSYKTVEWGSFIAD